VAILSGYPAQPTTSIVKIPSKASKLPMLSKVFNDSGYYTSFHYGGELEFANMKAYLMQGAFHQFVSVTDFDKKDQNSKWGAHDGVVMDRLGKDLAKNKQPFFSVWLTLSSHEPYEIPAVPILKGKDDASKFLSSLHYTDSIICRFISECKKQPWWSNTVVAIVADHGHRLLPTGKKADDFRIPLLLLGGALTKTGVEYNKLGSQTDLPATLLGQLKYQSKDFTWSKNLMDSSVKQWSYFSFNNGFGYVEAGKRFVYDNVGKRLIEKEGNLSDQELLKGKIIQQLSFQDYLDK
jgi:phosphoglycerol transferase MdoB-like AlkP superfamily enzyme